MEALVDQEVYLGFLRHPRFESSGTFRFNEEH